MYYPGPQGAETKPLVIFGGGFDSILEEYYPNFAEARLNVATLYLLTKDQARARHCVSTALRTPRNGRSQLKRALNEFLHTHAKPSKIVLIGMSMGGYFAPRAAAFEERIDGVVDYGTMYDFGAIAGPLIAAAKNPLAVNNISVSRAYRNALWTMGTKNVDETTEACAAYTLAPIALGKTY